MAGRSTAEIRSPMSRTDSRRGASVKISMIWTTSSTLRYSNEGASAGETAADTLCAGQADHQISVAGQLTAHRAGDELRVVRPGSGEEDRLRRGHVLAQVEGLRHPLEGDFLLFAESQSHSHESHVKAEAFGCAGGGAVRPARAGPHFGGQRPEPGVRRGSFASIRQKG